MTLNTLFDICPKKYPGYMRTSPIGGGSRTAATFKMELFGIIVNGFHHKELHLGCCSSSRSSSTNSLPISVDL